VNYNFNAIYLINYFNAMVIFFAFEYINKKLLIKKFAVCFVV